MPVPSEAVPRAASLYPMIRVLYAEDDSNVASVVRSYFSHFGPDIDLSIVPNGHECLTQMAKGGYDVLLLDLVLPDINGLQILGRVSTDDTSIQHTIDTTLHLLRPQAG